MNRRTFVVLLGAVAGCNSTASPGPSSETATSTRTRTATSTSTPQATETGTPEPTAESTEAPTETETPEPTETETPEPTEAERRATREIEQAKAQLTDVVETFTGDYGSELTAVTAASPDFLDLSYDLQTALADAQQAYADAENAAATEAQVRTADRLEGCWHFLDDARDAQMRVVEAYTQLASARDAFEDHDPDTARTAAEQMQTRRQQASGRFETLKAESSAEDASVIDSISETEYQNKVAQFEADIGVYEDLDDTLDDFVEGIKWFRLAIIEYEKDDRNVQDAESKANEARREIASARNSLNGMLGELGDDTTLKPILKSLRSIASDKAKKADEMGS